MGIKSIRNKTTMSLEELTPGERKIYNAGYKDGRSAERSAAAYLFVGYVFLFILVVKLFVDLKSKQ